MTNARRREALAAIAHFERCIEATRTHEARDRERIERLTPPPHPYVEDSYLLPKGEILHDSAYYERERRRFARYILGVRMELDLKRKELNAKRA